MGKEKSGRKVGKDKCVKVEVLYWRETPSATWRFSNIFIFLPLLAQKLSQKKTSALLLTTKTQQ